jgi:hypothetical protein
MSTTLTNQITETSGQFLQNRLQLYRQLEYNSLPVTPSAFLNNIPIKTK